MKNTIQIFAIFFSLITVFSCDSKRDLNGDLLFGLNPMDGDTPNGGTRLLKKMVSHSYDEDTDEWEDSQVIFNYTGNKLVSYDDGSGEAINIDYNANNKISKLHNSAQTIELQYSGGNVSNVISDMSGIMKINTQFSYTANVPSKAVSIYEVLFPIPSKTYLETSYEYSGQNMVKATLKAGFYLPNGDLEMNPEVQVIDFVYDTKKSPFTLLPKEFIYYISGIAPHGATYLSASNAIKMIQSLGGVSNTTTTGYIYDSEGYPTEGTSDSGETVKYEYQ